MEAIKDSSHSIPINIEEEMRTSYLDYAMSVIIGRALPDVRDGLKPVHRRVLYAMFREGLLHNRKYSKCAGVVGEVLKKYHPHGDGAVYDTLVRMAQPWNMRYPLVDGQGNFGSIDGDSAAAYRYTECKMQRLAEMMLRDIDKSTVDFMENFDGSTQEPKVLPTRFPTLLVNGSDGIAVGMATKIPPHNLFEVINACVHLIDDPSITVRELVLGREPLAEDNEAAGDQIRSFGPLVPGPDFPTGGIASGLASILQAYETGRGIVQIRAKTEIEVDEKTGRERIVVHEIPYQVNKARLVEKIAELVRDRKVEGISDLRDESNRVGMRVVIELKRDAYPEVVLNQLYKHSPLQSSFGINMLAIVEGRPKLLSLREMLDHFINHRRAVTTRRCRYELEQAQARAHILEGLRKALDMLDQVIAAIRASRSTAEARERLMSEDFGFSERQAQAILDMRLQKLTGLEQEKIVEELNALLMEIERLDSILRNESLLLKLVKDELIEVRDLFSDPKKDPRRTEISMSVDGISMEDLIADEQMVVTLTQTGYIKRCPLTEYRAQRRGGRGVQGMNTRAKDEVVELFVASNHEHILIFTNRGRLFVLKVYETPQGSRAALGRPLINLIKLEEGEKPAVVLPMRDFEEDKFVFFSTRKGIVKKTDLMSYARIRSSGLIAINIDDDDELLGVAITDGDRHIFLGTRQGKAIHFTEEDVRATGRATRGVRGITLQQDDEVVSLVVTELGRDILTVTTKGFGKRTVADDYRMTKRGGKGVITIKCSDRNGDVAGMVEILDGDQLMFSTNDGRVIRIFSNEIRQQGRNTLGVRLFRVDPKKEYITSVTTLQDDEEDELEEGVEGEVSDGEASAETSTEAATEAGAEASDAQAATGEQAEDGEQA